MSERPSLRHPAWCLLFLPLVLPVLLLLVSVGYEVYYSFTQYNVLSLPEAVGWENYASVFGNELFWKATGNTVLYLTVGGGICLALGWLCGSGAARMPLPLRLVLLALAGLGTLLALCQQAWLPYLLSADSYGLLNALLLDNRVITEPILWGQQFATAVRLFQLVLLGLGPAFCIFYVGGRVRRTRAAWHIAVAALPLWLLLNWSSTIAVTGYPSVDYAGVWLPELFYDYHFIRYDIGYGGALCVWLLLVVGLLIGAAQVLVWLASRLFGRREATPEPTVLHWFGGVVGLAGSLPVLGISALLVNLAVRPMDEFLLFPPPVFTQRPTVENFTVLESLWSPFSQHLRFGTYALVTLVVYVTVVLLPAVFLAFFAPRWRRWMLVAWLAVMCLAPFSVTSHSWYELQRVLDVNIVDMLNPVLFLECLHSPLLPASLLLTALLLRQSGAGCADFSAYFRSPRRVMRAVIGMVGCYLMYLLALPFGQYTAGLLFRESNKFPLTVMGMLSSRPGVASAAAVWLLGLGMVFLVGGLAAVTGATFRRVAEEKPVKYS